MNNRFKQPSRRMSKTPSDLRPVPRFSKTHQITIIQDDDGLEDVYQSSTGGYITANAANPQSSPCSSRQALSISQNLTRSRCQNPIRSSSTSTSIHSIPSSQSKAFRAMDLSRDKLYAERSKRNRSVLLYSGGVVSPFGDFMLTSCR